MKTPLLCGKRRPVPVGAAAQYVGTETEIDEEVSDRELKTAIRPLVGGSQVRPVADDDGRS